jgi:hypothetical protein
MKAVVALNLVLLALAAHNPKGGCDETLRCISVCVMLSADG